MDDPMKFCLNALLLLLFVTPVIANQQGLVVSKAWVREAPPGVGMLAGYLDLDNPTDSEWLLIDAHSDAFASVEVHTTIIKDGVASMHHLPELAIAAGQQASFSPGGMHLMLMGPVKSLKVGDRVVIDLDFGEHGVLSVNFPVRRSKP